MEDIEVMSRPRVVFVDNDGPEVGRHLLEDIADVYDFVDPVRAEKEIISIRPDHVVIDLLMPELSGDELIRRLCERGLNCGVTFRSGFLDAEEVANLAFLNRLGGELSDKHSVGSREFFEALRARLINKGSEQSSPRAEDDLVRQPKQRSLLDFSYEEFRDLTQEDRYSFVERAQRLLENEIAVSFEGGAAWYLYGGQNAQPWLAASISEIPLRKDIEDWCRTRNIPVIQCFRGISVDDITLGWNGSCADSMRDYPLLGISGTGRPADVVPVHFDTGSPVSFADFVVLSKLVSDLAPRGEIDFTPFIVNGEKIKVAHERISIWLVDPDGNSPLVPLSLVVPKDWNDLPIRHRLCSSSCGRNVDERVPDILRNYGYHERGDNGAHYCWYRWGLIGRSFLLESGLSIILDGRNRIIRLYGGQTDAS